MQDITAFVGHRQFVFSSEPALTRKDNQFSIRKVAAETVINQYCAYGVHDSERTTQLPLLSLLHYSIAIGPPLILTPYQPRCRSLP